jgi:hypothetical protein
MAKLNFGFFSSAGESFACDLMNEICEAMHEGTVVRERIMDRVSDVIEQIASIEMFEPDPVVFANIARRLNKHLPIVGLRPTSSREIRKHYREWSRQGFPVDKAIEFPDEVAAAETASRALTEAITAVAVRSGISLAVADDGPWCPDGSYARAIQGGADIVLFSWNSDTGGAPYIGCAVASEDSGSYLEEILECGAPALALRDDYLGDRPGLDFDALVEDLTMLLSAMRLVNEAASIASHKGKFSLLLTQTQRGPTLSAVWAGRLLSEFQKVEEIKTPISLNISADDLLSDIKDVGKSES